jgi:hypothetical protein
LNGKIYYSNTVPFTVFRPVITSMDATSAMPGDPLLINGANFDTNAAVHLRLDGGTSDYVITPDASNPTQLMLTIPDNILVPMGGLPGSIFVQNNATAKSDPVRFTLNPIVDIIDLSLDKLNVVQFTKLDPGDTYTIQPPSSDPLSGYYIPADFYATHYCGSWEGHHSDPDDLIELPVTLKNGYVFDHADIDTIPLYSGDASITEQWYRNGVIHVKIHWWIDPDWPDGGSIDYFITLYVKGPIQFAP